MKSGAVVYAKDLPRMELFYRVCFDMDAVDTAEDYSVLESETLMLSLSRPRPRTPRRDDRDFWAAVSTVEQFGQARTSSPDHRGPSPGHRRPWGSLDPPTAHWQLRDIIPCDSVDPEGNVIQLLHADAGPP